MPPLQGKVHQECHEDKIVVTFQTELKAPLMKDWHREYKLFQNHQGIFTQDWIWELAKIRKLVVFEIE